MAVQRVSSNRARTTSPANAVLVVNQAEQEEGEGCCFPELGAGEQGCHSAVGQPLGSLRAAPLPPCTTGAPSGGQ